MLLVAQTLNAIGEFRAVLFHWRKVDWGGSLITLGDCQECQKSQDEDSDIYKQIQAMFSTISDGLSYPVYCKHNLSYLYLSWRVPTSLWLLKVTLNTDTYYWDTIPCFAFSPFDWLDTIVLWYLPLLRSFKTPIRSETLDVYLKKESNTRYDHLH